MTLINCLVNVPEDVAFRIRIRREFINLGVSIYSHTFPSCPIISWLFFFNIDSQKILSIIKSLRSHDEDDLLVQLDVFEDGMESDAEEAKMLGIGILPLLSLSLFISILYILVEITSIDEEDPAKIFAFLRTSTTDTPFYLPFLQTLQHYRHHPISRMQ